MSTAVSHQSSIGFLGPSGTFTEEALRSQPDLAAARLVPLASFAHVFDAVAEGRVDYGFVALENSIEGTVLVTLDQLVFSRELYIVAEAVLPVTQNLLGPTGMTLDQVARVISFPHATGQCRRWLADHLPDATQVAATSTAEAVRQVGEEIQGGGARDTAAIGTALAASLYGLAVLVPRIEDHDYNATRFVLVGAPEAGIPAPTGHDKTSVVCFQSADRPGSLHGILGQFSARDINLVKLESRPTKQGLGDYCFIIDFEGHVADEVVADCLRDLHATLHHLKFLGSYPTAGDGGAAIRRNANETWRAADEWIATVRRRVRR